MQIKRITSTIASAAVYSKTMVLKKTTIVQPVHYTTITTTEEGFQHHLSLYSPVIITYTTKFNIQ